MANRYVRLYRNPGKRETSTLIGFSMSASDVDPVHNKDWQEMLTGFNYEVRELLPDKRSDRKKLDALAGVSFRYFEIRPPLAEEHIPSVARLCAQQVDPYHNDAYLLDNRNLPPPFRPFDSRGTVIARW